MSGKYLMELMTYCNVKSKNEEVDGLFLAMHMVCKCARAMVLASTVGARVVLSRSAVSVVVMVMVRTCLKARCFKT
jgi:hypothetical protein